MNISTWNVNGIRAALGKGLLDWINLQRPDVLCLQEVKAKPDQVPNLMDYFPEYQVYWNPAERAGYSGVMCLIKGNSHEVTYGLGVKKFDEEGRVIRVRFPNFYLYNIYFPNGQRGQERVDYKLEFYSILLEECDLLHSQGNQIILTGDFNTAHNDIDLANPRENSKNSGFLPEERVWIDYYLEHNFVDAYRQLFADRVQYTWWTYRMGARGRNIGWRLDYHLVSKELMAYVTDVTIYDQVMGSDHCPVSLSLHDG